MNKDKILEGLKIANNILLKYNAYGLLFGSALSLLFNKQARNNPKDIDILILSPLCEHHPERGEGTKYSPRDSAKIDWWVYHSSDRYPIQRPSNDNLVAKGNAADLLDDWVMPDFQSQVGLYWNAQIKEGVILSPGLYIPKPSLAKKIIRTELPKIRVQQSKNKRAIAFRRKKILKLEKQLSQSWDKNFYSLPYPLISEGELRIQSLGNQIMSAYCKHRYYTGEVKIKK